MIAQRRNIMLTPSFHALHLRRNLIAGALILAPLWVTWIVLQFIFTLLSGIGRPWVHGFVALIGGISPAAGAFLSGSLLESLLAALLTLIVLYLLGFAASRVVARQVIARIEAVLNRIPFVQVIYGSTKRMLAALQTKPDHVQRVVLLDFPAPPLKTIGLVTRIVRDTSSGRDVAVVYVPTSPNPTSGYMELVPVDQLVSTDWSLDEAMRFVITGGTSAPAEMNLGPRSAADRAAPN
jgi:uncharacterized membrane protein